MWSGTQNNSQGSKYCRHKTKTLPGNYRMLASVSLVDSHNSNEGHWNDFKMCSGIQFLGAQGWHTTLTFFFLLVSDVFLMQLYNFKYWWKPANKVMPGRSPWGNCVNIRLTLFRKRVSTIHEWMGTLEVLDSGWEKSILLVWLGNATQQALGEPDNGGLIL